MSDRRGVGIRVQQVPRPEPDPGPRRSRTIRPNPVPYAHHGEDQHRKNIQPEVNWGGASVYQLYHADQGERDP